MKLKKNLALALTAAMAMSSFTCGSTALAEEAASGVPTYSQITLGEDYTDLTAEISWFHNRTDREADGSIANYIAEFNKVYPNIKVTSEASTDYTQDALLRLSTGGDWGDIMMNPSVDKDEMPNFFQPYGTLEEMTEVINFAEQHVYDGICYAIPYQGSAFGIVYNKAVFEEAGITELPKTPDEFIAALQAIKDNTDAIPLYTHYGEGWTMGEWDFLVGVISNGDTTYMNQVLPHTANPFDDPGDGTGAYNVYKILYDAVANGLIEEDYTTTDWEGGKAMLNRGEIGCVALGTWYIAQAVAAGDNGDDIGFMPFPITVDGQQYVCSTGDNAFAINVNADDTRKTASMVFVKWMIEESGYSMNEGGYATEKGGENPEIYASLEDCVVVGNAPAITGEETLLNDLNSESELSIASGGNAKVQRIVEAAATGSETFDEIMADWTAAWNDAQEYLGVEVNQ